MDAAVEQPRESLPDLRGHRQQQVLVLQRSLQSPGMCQQCCGIIHGVFGAMPIMESCALQPDRCPAQQLRAGYGVGSRPCATVG
jgi:hypothetical protein